MTYYTDSKNSDNKDEIRVGEVLHPMTEEHHIVFIETISEDRNKVQLQYLYPGDEPKMLLNDDFKNLTAREFCNLHGLWEGKSD